MAASTANRFDMSTVYVAWLELPVAAGIHIFKGVHVCVNTTTGGVVQAADAANLVYVGQSEQEVDNTAGTLGALNVRVLTRREIKFARFNAVSPSATWLMKPAFFTDDNTVAISGTTNSIAAGRIVRIDNTGTAGSVVVEVADPTV